MDKLYEMRICALHSSFGRLGSEHGKNEVTRQFRRFDTMEIVSLLNIIQDAF